MEKEYTIYFELFGKKMKTTITATSKIDAEEKVKNKIIFHKTIENDDESMSGFGNEVDRLMDMFGM